MSADKSRAARLADRLDRPGYDAQKERDTTEAAAELRRLDDALERADIKAEAGLCYFTLASAREFLKDVRAIIKDARNG